MAVVAASPRGVPVSPQRVEECLSSAGLWVLELPRYADRQQWLADAWAIASGVLAALTGLAIFPVLGTDSTTLEKAIVSAVAFAAAICSLVPRVRNYAELAGQARELTSRYGRLLGDLTDLTHAHPLPQERARAVVEEFQAIKEKKDALRGLPDKARVEAQIARAQGEVALAREAAAKADIAAATARKAANAAMADPAARESSAESDDGSG